MNRIIKAICALLICLAAAKTVPVPVYALENTLLTDKSEKADVVDCEISDQEEDEVSTVHMEEEGVKEEETPVASTEEEPVEAETESAECEPVPEETAAEPVEAGKLEIPLYLQTDYPDTLYGSGTIQSSGCSITSLAMVATYMTGHEYLPDELADYFGGYVGNNMERLEYASDMLQLPWRKAGDWHDALRAMQEGSVVIALMNQKSAFTDSQHFIVLTGLTEDGKVFVNDPYGPNYNRVDLKDGFDNGFSQGYISTGYSGAWIYNKSAMPEQPFIYVEEEKPYVEPRYPEFNLTEEEINLLARMVWVEAQGEPFEGQQAVAEVVLNRLAADNFPDTLKGVIYAEGQFRSASQLEDAQTTQTQYEAIEQALYGPYVLPMDVVFFAQYPVNENVWGKIGGHTFCYRW